MNDTPIEQSDPSEPWYGIGNLLEKLQRIGWIEGAYMTQRKLDPRREVRIVFTPDGKAGLKPFADLFHEVGGLYGAEALAVFFAAIQSQKS